jgi:hypothetical protein
LEPRRHFVGVWTQSGRILAGSDQDAIYNLRPSRSDPVSHSTISWTGLSINGGKFLTVATTFNIGKKDFAPALKASEPNVYENHIGAASNITVLFYSSHDRRSWLLDGASALVHLARAWLTSRATKHGTSQAISQLKYIRDNGGQSSALQILRDNQKVIIFEDTTEVRETTIPAESMSEHDNPSTDSGYMSRAGSTSPDTKRSVKRTTSQWTYKALVIDLWENLKAMEAKLTQLAQHGPEVSVRLPSTSPILTGWDVCDFLVGRTPLQPRFVKLEPEGKHWNKLTKEIFSVPLMAKTFHDLILPSTGSQVCQSASKLPAGRDLLAVPVSVLLLTASRFLEWEENLAHEYGRVTEHKFLVAAQRPEGHCRCSKDANCEAISGLTKKAIKGTRTGPSIFQRSAECAERAEHDERAGCAKCAEWAKWADAVMIIGTPDIRRIWEPMSRDSGSSKQLVLPVSDHHAASSSSSVGITTSNVQSASQNGQAELNDGGSESHHATPSSSSVTDITSNDRSASQDNREDYGEGGSGSSTQAVLSAVDRAAASSSNPVVDIIPDAAPTSPDNQEDLSEGESGSISDDSFHDCYEDL